MADPFACVSTAPACSLPWTFRASRVPFGEAQALRAVALRCAYGIARWDRLCRRWATKHRETPERARFYAAVDRTTCDLGFPPMSRGQIEAALGAAERERIGEELSAKRFQG